MTPTGSHGERMRDLMTGKHEMIDWEEWDEEKFDKNRIPDRLPRQSTRT